MEVSLYYFQLLESRNIPRLQNMKEVVYKQQKKFSFHATKHQLLNMHVEHSTLQCFQLFRLGWYHFDPSGSTFEHEAMPDVLYEFSQFFPSKSLISTWVIVPGSTHPNVTDTPSGLDRGI